MLKIIREQWQIGFCYRVALCFRIDSGLSLTSNVCYFSLPHFLTRKRHSVSCICIVHDCVLFRNIQMIVICSIDSESGAKSVQRIGA